MTKDELIDFITNDMMPKSQARKAVTAALDVIVAALGDGEDVTLHGFGTFSAPTRAASRGRNPRTGEPVDIPARRVVKFSPAKLLRDRLR